MIHLSKLDASWNVYSFQNRNGAKKMRVIEMTYQTEKRQQTNVNNDGLIWGIFSHFLL